MADVSSALKRQLEQKWRALDNFEALVKKLETTRSQWRSKYAIKDGELDAAKVGHHHSFCSHIWKSADVA